MDGLLTMLLIGYLLYTRKVESTSAKRYQEVASDIEVGVNENLVKNEQAFLKLCNAIMKQGG